MDVQNQNQGMGNRLRVLRGRRSERGASMIELAFILPILIVLAYGVVDIGRLIHARLVITNVSREGGSLASRGIRTGSTLVGVLQSSATPFDLKNAEGKIWITSIKAGTSTTQPEPYIASRFNGGLLNAPSSITGPLGGKPAGLSTAIYNHLQFDSLNKTSDIAEVTVVEVFYLYRPITPLPKFVKDLVLPGSGGMLIGSKAVF